MRVTHGNRGFCNINNEAVMVEYIRDYYPRPDGRPLRIAIVDTDVHHGDGSQDIFWNDPHTLFISLHQDGRTLYPGSGFPQECGGPGALGRTINIPLPPETSDECYKMAYTDAISVAAKALGIGADVYWAAGRTKYSQDEKKEPVYCTRCKQKLKDEIKTSKRTFTAQEYFDKFGGLCPDCATADYAARKNKGEGE